MERSQRRIPVQYPRRSVGRQMTQASTSHLPLKINTAGVVPPMRTSFVQYVALTPTKNAPGDELRRAIIPVGSTPMKFPSMTTPGAFTTGSLGSAPT